MQPKKLLVPLATSLRIGSIARRNLWRWPLAGLALVFFAGPTYAGDQGFGWDYKTLPGAACQPQIGAQAGDFERYPHSILNVSETGRTVICPLVRDTVTGHDLDIGVTVTTDTKCKFFIMNYKGDEVGAPGGYTPTDTAVLDIDREVQYFLVSGKDIDPNGFVGYYALQCTLPPFGEVFSFIFGENAETTDYGE